METELGPIFCDCELAIIPPLGQAAGLDAIANDTLAEQTDTYFDAGEHEEVLPVSAEMLRGMIGDPQLMQFSRHV